jgi:ribonuclease P/MRP protein subunit POP8
MDSKPQNARQQGPRLQKDVTFTLRSAPYTYLHLSVIDVVQAVSRAPLDAVTARTYLTSALSQYLGLTGAAVPIDILKVTNPHIWIRVPKEDASAVVVAVGQWANAQLGVSLKVEARGEWLGGLVAGGEVQRHELFSLTG